MARKLFAEVSALKGKPGWFCKEVGFGQVFWHNSWQCLPSRKKNWKSGVMLFGWCIIFSSFSECVLRAQLHASESRPHQGFQLSGRVREENVTVMCSFKNTNSTHWEGVTNSLEIWGSETLLKIQKEGCVTRGFGVQRWEVSVDMIWPEECTQTHVSRRWPGRQLEWVGNSCP